MNQIDYLAKEAEYVRDTILVIIDKIEALERYALFSTGAIWGWAVANSQSPGVRFLWWSPIIIQSLFSFRAWVKWKHLELHMKYLSRIEKELKLEASYGIGTYVLTKWGKVAEMTGVSFWVILNFTTILISLLLPSRIRG